MERLQDMIRYNPEQRMTEDLAFFAIDGSPWRTDIEALKMSPFRFIFPTQWKIKVVLCMKYETKIATTEEDFPLFIFHFHVLLYGLLLRSKAKN